MINFIKKNYKIICIYIIAFIVLTIEFPYYVEAPGGIIDVKDRINIESSYNSSGSFNLAYVSEYKGTIPMFIISLFNKDYKILKKNEVLMDNQTINDYELRDKLLLKEAYASAIYVGYIKAGVSINVLNDELYVDYIFEDSDTDLKVGDKIIEVDNISVSSREDIDNILTNHNIGDNIEIKVISNNHEYIRKSTLINYQDKPIIGISVIKIRNMETIPKISINYHSHESGPSGGLLLALSIYNDLIEEDITHGLKIVGTGTIDYEGNVGSIGGVEYKLKSAVKNKADLFIVPNGENYESVIKEKKQRNYKIEIIGVNNIDDVIEYLKKRN